MINTLSSQLNNYIKIVQNMKHFRQTQVTYFTTPTRAAKVLEEKFKDFSMTFN